MNKELKFLNWLLSFNDKILIIHSIVFQGCIQSVNTSSFIWIGEILKIIWKTIIFSSGEGRTIWK